MGKGKPNIDAKINLREHLLGDLRAEVARLRGQVARRDEEVARLRKRVIAVAGSTVTVCARCGTDAERSMVEQNLRSRVSDLATEVAQLRQLLAAGGVEQT